MRTRLKKYNKEAIQKLLSLILLLLVVWFGIDYQNGSTLNRQQINVIKIIDGDTIEVEDGIQIRYIGIDSPEYGENYFDEATKLNESLLATEHIYLEEDISKKDKYDRVLGYIWAGDKLINEEMLKSGLAFPLFIPPNKKYQDRFIKAFEYAQKQDLNLWKDKDKKVSSYRIYNNW